MNFVTIPGFEAMTKQQLFDLSLAHIRKTRTQSVVPTGARENFEVCSYATGAGCAARPFLTDEFVASLNPGELLDQNCWRQLSQGGFVPAANAEFIAKLQNAHDEWTQTIHRTDDGPGEPNPVSFMDHFHARMQIIADEYGLTYTPE